MGINTRIHDRRKRHRQRQENAIKTVIARATKGFNAGLHLEGETLVKALEKYIDGLRVVVAEMESEYGPDAKRRLWRIDHEIGTAIEAISKLKIDQVKPE